MSEASIFVPAHALVTSPGVAPARWMVVLHGILGSGANWRGFSRRLAAAAPSWGFILVDLRMHGRSQHAPPPHSLEAEAQDLARLGAHLGLPIAGVLGHSFGGKVALAYASRGPAPLAQVWVLDACPGTSAERPSATDAVIATLRKLQRPFASRELFVEAVAANGHPRAIAEWLAMNVRTVGDGLRFALDLDAIEGMLEDYRAHDLWAVLEEAPGDAAFHVVVAGGSDAFGPADRTRLASIAARQARVHAHLIEHAGHWLHVDAPDALFDLVRAELGESDRAT